MDEFEFNQVPKFINFNDEVARNDSHEKSAYFNTVNLETPIRAPLPCSKEEKDVRDRGPIDFELPDLEKENEKPQAPAIDPFKAACSDALPPSSLSNLALFNPAASRVAQQARRRSALRAPTEIEAPALRRSARRPSQELAQQARRRSALGPTTEAEPRQSQSRKFALRSSKDVRQISRNDSVKSHESATIQRGQRGASSPKRTPSCNASRNYKAPTGKTPAKSLTRPETASLRRSNSICGDTKSAPAPDPFKAACTDALPPSSLSNLALFNPAASRVAQQARRRSALRAPTEIEAPALRRSARRPSQELAQQARRRSGLRSAKEVEASHPQSGQFALRSSKDVRQLSRNDSIKSHESGTSQRGQLLGASSPKRTPFSSGLRNYKAPTGNTPAKSLTRPDPFSFRRSNSKCRDTESDLDPRIRASVDRLSAPRKRDDSSISSRAPLSGRINAIVERLSSPKKR